MDDEAAKLYLELFDEVQEAVNTTILQMIDERTAGELDRRTYAVIAGKALIMSGCQFIGPALGLAPDDGLAPGYALLAEYSRLALIQAAEQRNPS